MPSLNPERRGVRSRRGGTRNVEIRQLEAFVAVVEYGHFGRAAKAINVSQPTLSKLVRRLEDQLGSPVFLRDTRNVTLSRAGEALLDDARIALDHVSLGVAAARAVAQGLAGEVVVGYSPAVRHTAATVIAAFSHVRPRVEIAHRQEYASWLSRRVERGDLDAAIVVSGHHPPPVEAMPLRDVEVACLVSTRHPLAGLRQVALTELAHHKIASPQPVNRDWQQQLVAEATGGGVALTFGEVHDPLGMAHEMIRARPDLVVVRPREDLEPAYGCIVPIVPAVRLRWDLVWNPDAETELVRALLTVARRIRDRDRWLGGKHVSCREGCE
jgi:DNA-binding transcriptional LysR family regulator